MTLAGYFKCLIASLERVGVPYMVTGSFASSIYGMPRSTNDVDVVIAPTTEQLQALIREFPPDRYYAGETDAFQFNVIDFATSWKADLFFRKDRDFSRVEFSRRRRWDAGGTSFYITTPEDILIAKLEWANLGEPERQLNDAAGILAMQGDALDRAYIEHWVGELGLDAQWQEALEKAR